MPSASPVHRIIRVDLDGLEAFVLAVEGLP
jgi:hypothetical protein